MDRQVRTTGMTSVGTHHSLAPRAQQGITMVEALVALVVLSTGMLGVASLYVSALRAERTAQTRTIAVGFVSDMVDRIRSNPPARQFYAVSNYASAPTLQGCVAKESNCSVEQLAQDDLASWLNAVKTTLPGTTTNPKATVEYVPGAVDRFRVAVAWRESGQETDLTYSNTVEVLPVTP